MNSATVLGATGFIGHHLTEALKKRGVPVWAPARPEIERDQYESLLRKPLGTVFYCIGLTSDFQSNPEETFNAHCSLLIRLLKHADYERLLYLSSTRLYDHGLKTNEDTDLSLNPGNPRHLFDLTKALGEHFTLLHSKGRGSVARLSSAYGTTGISSGFLSDLLKQLRKNRVLRLSSAPSLARDYIHIDDVVEGLLAIMGHNDAQGIYNIASGENICNATLIGRINKFGWNISLTPGDPAPALPAIEIGRLTALGIQPRSVLQFLDDHLGNSSNEPMPPHT